MSNERVVQMSLRNRICLILTAVCVFLYVFAPHISVQYESYSIPYMLEEIEWEDIVKDDPTIQSMFYTAAILTVGIWVCLFTMIFLKIKATRIIILFTAGIELMLLGRAVSMIDPGAVFGMFAWGYWAMLGLLFCILGVSFFVKDEYDV